MSAQAFPVREDVRRPRIPLVNLAIAVTTALGLALRIMQLTRPGGLTGIVEYDDGPYVGSAILLTHGILPYRDFIFVQPPGITLLLTPVALLSRLGWISTVTVMEIGRVLTMLVSSTGVLLAGLLVRHRGTLAVVVAGGILAIYPGSIQAAHTVLVEPWLVLLCLLGALVIFEGDRPTQNRRRLLWGGVLFGFAGAVEGWAIVPVAVIALLCLPRWRMLARFAAGVAAGFLVPVLPFILASPRGFYQGVITAQIGARPNAVRVSPLYRFKLLTGLTWAHPVSGWVTVLAALLVVALVVGSFGFACLATGRGPAPLEWFVLLTAAATIFMFLKPSQFIYHFAGWFGPFLALSVALSLTRCAETVREILPWSPYPWPQATVTVMAVPVLAGLAALQVAAVSTTPAAPVMAQELDQLIPPGACVLSDTSPPLIMLGRLVPSKPGCVILLDSTGANLELSHGLKPETGAWKSQPTEEMWWRAFRNAQYFLLRTSDYPRVPWTPKLHAWFRHNYTLYYRQQLSRTDYYQLYRHNAIQYVQVTPGELGQTGPAPNPSQRPRPSLSRLIRDTALTLAPSTVYLAAGLLLVGTVNWWRRRREVQDDGREVQDDGPEVEDDWPEAEDDRRQVEDYRFSRDPAPARSRVRPSQGRHAAGRPLPPQPGPPPRTPTTSRR